MFAQERDAFLFREPAAATESALERLVAKHPPPARLVAAHIRLATAGDASLAHTHPFRRTRSGRVLHFAHNGSLPNLKTRFAASEAAACIGDTDSELAFLLLLERRRPLEPDGTPEERYAVFREFCAEMREEGTSNFLFADGELLFAHAHHRRAVVDGTPSEMFVISVLRVKSRCRAMRTLSSGLWNTVSGRSRLLFCATGRSAK